MIHPSLEESDLYDEDPRIVQLAESRIKEAESKTAEVLFKNQPGDPSFGLSEITVPKDHYARVMNTAMDLISYRIILLLSVLVSGGLFGLATWYPDPWRLGAAAAFSVIVVAPLTFFYARK